LLGLESVREIRMAPLGWSGSRLPSDACSLTGGSSGAQPIAPRTAPYTVREHGFVLTQVAAAIVPPDARHREVAPTRWSESSEGFRAQLAESARDRCAVR
jgi:hypothetical protein